MQRKTSKNTLPHLGSLIAALQVAGGKGGSLGHLLFALSQSNVFEPPPELSELELEQLAANIIDRTKPTAIPLSIVSSLMAAHAGRRTPSFRREYAETRAAGYFVTPPGARGLARRRHERM